MNEIKHNSKESILGGALFIALIVLAIYFIDWGFLRSQITEYPLTCEVNYINNKCPGYEYASTPTTYKIIPKRQEVLYWSHDKDFSEVKKLSKCAVLNRKNWTCKYDDESAEFGFKNGQFWDVSNPTNITASWDKQFKYVSRYEYILKWWLK